MYLKKETRSLAHQEYDFRVRVCETARALFCSPSEVSDTWWDDAEKNTKRFKFIFDLAEQFERAAGEFLKGEK